MQIVRPVLGVTIAPPQTLRQLQLEGVLVLEVPQGTPAAKAGLQGTYRCDCCGWRWTASCTSKDKRWLPWLVSSSCSCSWC